MNYADFSKDNPFGLTERQFMKIRPYIDPDYVEHDDEHARVRPRTQPEYVRQFRRMSNGKHTLLDKLADEAWGYRFTTGEAEQFIHPLQLPTTNKLTRMLMFDGRFKIAGQFYVRVGGRRRVRKLWSVIA